MNIGTLAFGGGAYLGIGLRQGETIEAPDVIGINTFNGLGVVFYSPYGEQILSLTAGRGNGQKLEAEMEFMKYGNLKSFNLIVLRNIDVPFFNGMNVRFYYQDLPFACGYIDKIPTTDQESSIISLHGSGYSRKLGDKKITETYSSTTVLSILQDIGSTYFGDLGINYNSAKLFPASVSVSSITWDDKDILTVIGDLVSICNTAFETIEYVYGIDEYGDFYFKGISENDIEKSYFEGFKYQNPVTENDAESIINQIKLFRTTSEDNKKTEYVNTYLDQDSIDRNGLYEKKVTVADYVDNITAQNIADGIIADWKSPKTRITINDLTIDNVLPFAYYNITNKKQDQITVVSEFADDTEWTEDFSTSSSDIIDTNVYTGRLCYEWTINNSEDDYITKEVEYYMPTKLRIYVRQEDAGEYLSVSVIGKKANKYYANLLRDNDDNLETDTELNIRTLNNPSSILDSINIDIPFANEWTYFDLDLTGWFRIDSITFTVIDSGSTVILLDRLEIYTNSYISRNLSLETANYTFNQNNIKCTNATFGIRKLTLTEKLEEVNEKNNVPFDIFSKQ